MRVEEEFNAAVVLGSQFEWYVEALIVNRNTSDDHGLGFYSGHRDPQWQPKSGAKRSRLAPLFTQFPGGLDEVISGEQRVIG